MYARSRCAVLVLATLAASAGVQAQVSSVRDQVEALGLATLSLGRVTAHHSAGERVRAEHFARLSEDVAVFYETELGISFAFKRVPLLGRMPWKIVTWWTRSSCTSSGT